MAKPIYNFEGWPLVRVGDTITWRGVVLRVVEIGRTSLLLEAVGVTKKLRKTYKEQRCDAPKDK